MLIDIFFLFFLHSISPQDEQLADILREIRALRALVLAQGHRIDMLERQLAKLDDGEV